MNNLQGLQLWLRLQRQRFHILRLDKVALGGWMSRYPRSYERDFYQLKCWWRRGRGVWMEIERNGPEIQLSCFEILIFTQIRDFWAVFNLTCSLLFDVQCHWMKKKLKTINIEMKHEFVNRKIWQTVHACTDVKKVQLVGCGYKNALFFFHSVCIWHYIGIRLSFTDIHLIKSLKALKHRTRTGVVSSK